MQIFTVELVREPLDTGDGEEPSARYRPHDWRRQGGKNTACPSDNHSLLVAVFVQSPLDQVDGNCGRNKGERNRDYPKQHGPLNGCPEVVASYQDDARQRVD